MRRLNASIFLFTVLGFTSCSENENNVPEQIQEAFTQKFPTAEDVEWEKENASEWEVEFELGEDEKEYKAKFSSDGSWIETESEISKKDIPSDLISSIKKEYPNSEIEEVQIIESITGKLYGVEIEIDEKKVELLIDSEGVITKE